MVLLSFGLQFVLLLQFSNFVVEALIQSRNAQKVTMK